LIAGSPWSWPHNPDPGCLGAAVTQMIADHLQTETRINEMTRAGMP
jgi:hypothetical protein